MNPDIFLKYIKQYKYTILISIFVLVNFVSLNNVPWGDDYPFVFESYISTAENPFVFWNPYSKFFKSWPVSFSVLWAFLKVFESDVFFYRALNMTLHILNTALIYKLNKDVFNVKDENKNFLITALFLFHPISLGTINWIFQIKTLLSLFFGLLTIYFLHQIPQSPKKYFSLSVLFYFLAINSKIAVVLMPLYLFFKRKHFKSKNVFLSLFIIFSSMSAYYGLINIKGINAIWEEKKNIEKSIIEYSDDGKDTNTAQVVEEKIKRAQDQEVQTLGDEIKASFNSFTAQILKPGHLAEKGLIALFTFGRYITHSFGFNIYSVVYEKNAESLYALNLLGYSIITFLILWFFIRTKNLEVLLLCLCFYLPISGLFYVPYMKISYISDHWFYLSLPFILILIIKNFPKKITYIIALTIMAQSLFMTYNFRTSEKAIAHSLKYYNNTFVKEYFIKVSLFLEDYISAYDFTKDISDDYSIKKDEIVNAKFVINTFYTKNKTLWFDVKDYLALRYSEGNLPEMQKILAATIPYEHKQEKLLLKYLIELSLGVQSPVMNNDIENMLSIGTRPSHKRK